MKKIVLVLFCFVLGGFVFAGCSSSSGSFEEKSYMPDRPFKEIYLDVRDC